MEYYSAIKKNAILPFTTTGMDLEGIMFSEISQTQKGKILCFYLYVESKKQNKRMNITKQKQAHSTENKLVITSGKKDWTGTR